ncbi:HAMP domain-containing sensor histidine kinase [Thalassotalea sediminis]|uniref:HAMP domain-containing sensor histidine kinase n=1 Tax=Thalassotalea sediminis TaxID=1759089 RepID=UPI002572375F|nr:ATP-binding protein [Thalassotalea sediminis]
MRFALRNFSIKHLTIFGFTLVILPLVLTLLYGSQKLRQLAEQSTSSIARVATTVASDRQLSTSLNLLQRSASQYIVLEEKELLDRVYNQQQQIDVLLEQHKQQASSAAINLISQKLRQEVQQTLSMITAVEKPTLDDLQTSFKSMNTLSSELGAQNEAHIQRQVIQVQSSAKNTQKVLLNSVFIIPISIVIAILFSLMILKPLQSLQRKIQRLEQGKFDDEIRFSGATEVQDIAKALEKMRLRLHTLEQQKSSFIRHISHELKTPLAAIREGTELLYDNSLGELNDGQQEVTQIMRSNVNRLQTLIEGLLDFNIVLDSTSLLTAEPVRLANIIEECLTARKLELQANAISIDLNLQEISLTTNKQQLSVVIDNLLSNAIKYSPNNGKIAIEAYVESQQLICTITDQGPGINKALSNKVFDAFYQGPPPENAQIRSSGLGLTIVKELLKRLDGSILLKNQSKQSGLVAIITLNKLDNE